MWCNEAILQAIIPLQVTFASMVPQLCKSAPDMPQKHCFGVRFLSQSPICAIIEIGMQEILTFPMVLVADLKPLFGLNTTGANTSHDLQLAMAWMDTAFRSYSSSYPLLS